MSNSSAEYWKIRCKSDPWAWTRACLQGLGFSWEEIDELAKERQSADAAKAHREGRQILQSIRTSRRSFQRSLKCLEIQVVQRLIILDRRIDSETEEAHEGMEAVSD